MRKLILPISLLALSACSPAQEAAWNAWFHRDPQAATSWALNECGELCTNDTNHNGIVEPDAVSSSSDTSSSSSDTRKNLSAGRDADYRFARL